MTNVSLSPKAQPFSHLLPSRTPGPLGLNDAADPSVNAELGDTPGSLGVNDGAAMRAEGRAPLPARIVQSLIVGAVPFRKLKMLAGTKINLPDTKEVIIERQEGVVGQGFFEVHVGDYDENGNRTQKLPDVELAFNESTYRYEVSSISVYTIKIINNPNPRALPRAGDNVTNRKELGVRTPLDAPEGKGYWREVIQNMAMYQEGNVGRLQWYAPGSTAYHEEVHNQQFRSLIKKDRAAILKSIEDEANEQLEYLSQGVSNVSEDRVFRVVRKAILSTITNGTGDESSAYRKTFDALWKPQIDKIQTYAHDHGWNRD